MFIFKHDLIYIYFGKSSNQNQDIAKYTFKLVVDWMEKLLIY